MKLAAAQTRTLTLVVSLGSSLCLGQTTPAQPAFEAAAIKVSKAGDESSTWHSGKGRLTMDNLSVRQIIQAAYGVKENRLTGPGWIDGARYHIDAKADSNVNDGQLMPMLQTLLAERFHLVLHREKKEIAAYALVAAKGGIKMKPATPGDRSQLNSRNGSLTARNVTMAKLAEFLTSQLERPVVDETGTGEGHFDFTLEFANERMQRAAEADGGTTAKPSLFTALPEQIGLRLEARKVPVEVLVIDRVEPPTDN